MILKREDIEYNKNRAGAAENNNEMVQLMVFTKEVMKMLLQ